MNIATENNNAVPRPDNLKTKDQREEEARIFAEASPPGVFLPPIKPKKLLGRPKNEVAKVRKHGYWTASVYQKIEAEALEFGISVSEYVETLCVYARNVLKIGKKERRKIKK